MVRFFIDRPIFSSVMALVFVVAGGICMLTLPIAQFPEINPPSVQVTSNYTGAGAQTVAETVTTPLEEQINGVEGMIYMSSNSTSNGDSIITVTFDVGYSLDIGAVDVQNQAATANAQLPSVVQQTGVSVTKQSTNFVVIVNLVSPNDSYDEIYLSNYADIHVVDVLKRIPGVGQVTNFGERKYSMRIWLDPDKLTNLGLTATDVEKAIKEQNQQVAAGKVGAPPAPKGQVVQYQLQTLGRLANVEQFENIIVKANSDGSVIKIKDIGRVNLGSEKYDWSATLNGKPTAALGVFQLPGANALDLAKQVREKMKELKKRFPKDLEYTIVYDTTTFVKASITEVVVTLGQAILLVFLVVYIFLQSWRATLIPAITIPVSLVGTFAMMYLMGFSINTLSLLGLVLAIGLVVDDAIVVVENVSRQLEEGEANLRDAARLAMAEVTGPIIATTLVLSAVFVPVAFMPGITGQLYNQFALTIAFSVMISAINSLTLSPALCAVLLSRDLGTSNWFFLRFNRFFDATTRLYEKSVRTFARLWYGVFLLFGMLAVLTFLLFRELPTSFLPEEDQGYFFVVSQLPDASSLQETQVVAAQVRDIVSKTEGVADVMTVAGYNIITSTTQVNAVLTIVILKPWDERTKPVQKLPYMFRPLMRKFQSVSNARIVPLNPPAIPGLGSTGGFTMEIQDLDNKGPEALFNATMGMIEESQKVPALKGLFTTYRANVPELFIDVDREKAKTMGVSLNELFDTLQINLGSMYINDFNKFGRVYRVYLQAEQEYRATKNDIKNLYVRNDKGKMIPLSELVTIEYQSGPDNSTHYNLYASAQLNGNAAPGFSTGEAMDAMENLANHVLPDGFGFEWTAIAYQQKKAGNLAPFVFAMSLLFVYMFLAALYESWSMPFMVLFAVPLALLGAALALKFRHMDLDVYGQIGLVMLIGLAAKNAILIVEFAKRRREEGVPIVQAAMDAASARLRPILMTAFAFILGTLPLAIAAGAGAQSRQSLGTTVVGGMFVATMLSLVVVPVFYVVIEIVREGAGGEQQASTDTYMAPPPHLRPSDDLPESFDDEFDDGFEDGFDVFK